MILTAEALMKGNQEIEKYFARARRHWERLLAARQPEAIAALAEKLPAEQSWFELECGGRWLGQEIMAISALAYFYDSNVGFGDNLQAARAVVKAFSESLCSTEVKSEMDLIQKIYRVME